VAITDTEIEVRLSATGIRLYDAVGASVIATDTTLTLADGLQVIVTESATYYRTPTALEWTKVTYTLTTGTPGGSRSTQHTVGSWITGASVTVRAAGVSTSAPTDGTSGARVGRVTPCYLPAAVGAPALLTLYDGPGFPGDAVTIPPRGLYPIDHLDPAAYPSPDTRWRSTQASSVEYLTWDLGDETEIGRAVALVVAGANEN